MTLSTPCHRPLEGRRGAYLIDLRLEVDKYERDNVLMVQLLKAGDRAQETVADALARVDVVEHHLATHQTRLRRAAKINSGRERSGARV